MSNQDNTAQTLLSPSKNNNNPESLEQITNNNNNTLLPLETGTNNASSEQQIITSITSTPNISFENNLFANLPNHDPSLRRICCSFNDTTIVFGTEQGHIYFHDRYTLELKLTISHQELGQKRNFTLPITKVSLTPNLITQDKRRAFLGAVDSAFIVYIFEIELTIQQIGNANVCFPKVARLLNSHSQHKSEVTCIAWANDFLKLFTGDTSGFVFEFKNQKKSLLSIGSSTQILKEDGAGIVQLSVSGEHLLISSTKRSIDVNLSAQQYKGIGTKPRDGVFGACFQYALKKKEENVSSNTQLDQYTIYAFSARPGRRIWCSDVTTCKVLSTLKFPSVSQVKDLKFTNLLSVGPYLASYNEETVTILDIVKLKILDVKFGIGTIKHASSFGFSMFIVHVDNNSNYLVSRIDLQLPENEKLFFINQIRPKINKPLTSPPPQPQQPPLPTQTQQPLQPLQQPQPPVQSQPPTLQQAQQSPSPGVQPIQQPPPPQKKEDNPLQLITGLLKRNDTPPTPPVLVKTPSNPILITNNQQKDTPSSGGGSSYTPNTPASVSSLTPKVTETEVFSNNTPKEEKLLDFENVKVVTTPTIQPKSSGFTFSLPSVQIKDKFSDLTSEMIKKAVAVLPKQDKEQQDVIKPTSNVDEPKPTPTKAVVVDESWSAPMLIQPKKVKKKKKKPERLISFDGNTVEPTLMVEEKKPPRKSSFKKRTKSKDFDQLSQVSDDTSKTGSIDSDNEAVDSDNNTEDTITSSSSLIDPSPILLSESLPMSDVKSPATPTDDKVNDIVNSTTVEEPTTTMISETVVQPTVEELATKEEPTLPCETTSTEETIITEETTSVDKTTSTLLDNSTPSQPNNITTTPVVENPIDDATVNCSTPTGTSTEEEQIDSSTEQENMAVDETTQNHTELSQQTLTEQEQQESAESQLHDDIKEESAQQEKNIIDEEQKLLEQQQQQQIADELRRREQERIEQEKIAAIEKLKEEERIADELRKKEKLEEERKRKELEEEKKKEQQKLLDEERKRKEQERIADEKRRELERIEEEKRKRQELVNSKHDSFFDNIVAPMESLFEQLTNFLSVAGDGILCPKFTSSLQQWFDDFVKFVEIEQKEKHDYCIVSEMISQELDEGQQSQLSKLLNFRFERFFSEEGNHVDQSYISHILSVLHEFLFMSQCCTLCNDNKCIECISTIFKIEDQHNYLTEERKNIDRMFEQFKVKNSMEIRDQIFKEIDSLKNDYPSIPLRYVSSLAKLPGGYELCALLYPYIQVWNFSTTISGGSLHAGTDHQNNNSDHARKYMQYLVSLYKHNHSSHTNPQFMEHFVSKLIDDYEKTLYESLILNIVDESHAKMNCFTCGGGGGDNNQCFLEMELKRNSSVQNCLYYFYEKFDKIFELIEIIVGGNDLANLVSFMEKNYENQQNWITLMNCIENAPKPICTKEQAVFLMCKCLGSIPTLTILQDGSIESCLHDVDPIIYTKICELARAETEQSKLRHNMVEIIDSYLWSEKDECIAPQVRSILSFQTDIPPSLFSSTNNNPEEAFPYISSFFKLDSTSKSSFNNDFQTELPRFTEDCGSNWGSQIRVGRTARCLCCRLPLTERVGGDVMVFPCGHCYHRSCNPMEVCTHNGCRDLSSL